MPVLIKLLYGVLWYGSVRPSVNNLQDIFMIPGKFFYVGRVEDLMRTAKINAYIMHIFGKIYLLLSQRFLKKASRILQLPPSVRPSHYLILNHWTKSNQNGV